MDPTGYSWKGSAQESIKTLDCCMKYFAVAGVLKTVVYNNLNRNPIYYGVKNAREQNILDWQEHPVCTEVIIISTFGRRHHRATWI